MYMVLKFEIMKEERQINLAHFSLKNKIFISSEQLDVFKYHTK